MLAILLAAGKGRRIGVPKAFLDLGGRTALERCVDTLEACGLERIKVVVSPDGAHRLGARPPRTGPVELVVNPTPEHGQTSSLKRALAGESGDFLLHTVDHPLVTSADIRGLLEAWSQRAPETTIVAPSVGGRRGHPCVHAAELAAEFLALDDQAPAHTVIRADAHRVEHLLLDDFWIVHDIDEPADLDDALSELARRGEKHEPPRS
jgi:CTP:molybdopterin cytidylyltransferase MocA